MHWAVFLKMLGMTTPCSLKHFHCTGQSQLSPGISFDKKLAPGCDTCPNGQWASLSQGEVSTKSNNSGFWTFWTSKLTNFKTRFWKRATCHVYSEGTCG